MLEDFPPNKLITVEDFAKQHTLSHYNAAVLLGKLAKQKQLVRLKIGIYYPLTSGNMTLKELYDDPLVLVPLLFPEACVGGWSAANFWNLWKMTFKEASILTKQDVYSRSLIHVGHLYYKFKPHIPLSAGVNTVIRNKQEIKISDIHRTVIDMLENPKCGHGIQHTLNCTKTYFDKHYNPDVFISYAEMVKNGRVLTNK